MVNNDILLRIRYALDIKNTRKVNSSCLDILKLRLRGEVIRTLIARMNKGCEPIEVYSDFINKDSIIQVYLSRKSYRYIFVDCGNGKKHPNEILYEELEKRYRIPTIKCKAVKLKVKLDLEKFDIWRSVIVPLNYTFGEFHKIIRELFDWKDYHLHEFMIYEGDEPIINIVGSEEDFEYQMETPMVMESKVKVSEYLPKYKRLLYRYLRR